MKKTITTLVCAFAVLAFSTTAWAENETTPDLAQKSDLADAIDFAEAVEYGELVDFFVDDDNENWEVYYDELQNFMWEQRAGISPEEAQESLSRNGILTVTLMTPELLQIYYRTWSLQGCLSDTNNHSYTNFNYHSLCGRGCYRYVTNTSGGNHWCVYGISGRGTTGPTNYCTWSWAGQICHVSKGDNNWHSSTNCWCQEAWFDYKYYNSRHNLVNWYISHGSDVVRTQYKIDSTQWRAMIINYSGIE